MATSLRARPPAVCLPGLSRTGEDFDILATALAGDAARIAGFGARLSRTWTFRLGTHPKNYTVATELDDVLAVLTALEAAPAISSAPRAAA